LIYVVISDRQAFLLSKSLTPNFLIDEDKQTMKQFPTPDELKGAVMGTLLYMMLFVFCIQFQSYSKLYLLSQKRKEKKKIDDISSSSSSSVVSLKKIKYYNNDDKLALIGDRTVGNFIEFAWFFLSLLWIHALFVDPTQSFRLAALYTFFRSYYPLVFAKGFPLLLLSTVPNYIVGIYMIYEIVTKFVLA
jgi:hypothetical protein